MSRVNAAARLGQRIAGLLEDAPAIERGADTVVLLHGGKEPVTKIDPNRLMQSVHSTGFHTTNKIPTPYTFATRGGREGVISAFEFPRPLYEKMLRLNDKPITNYPGVEESVSAMMQQDPALREDFLQRLKSMFQNERQAGNAVTPGDLATGERVNSWMRKFYGGMDETDPRLAAAGIPGRTWQYSAERPSEMATAVFPEFFGELRPIGQLPVAPGNMMKASRDLRYLLD